MTTACASYETKKPFEGVVPNIERRWRETDSAWVREELERYQSSKPCEVCNGHRLKPEALAVKIAGLHIGEVALMSIDQAAALVRGARPDAEPASSARSPRASSRRSTSGSASWSMSASNT